MYIVYLTIWLLNLLKRSSFVFFYEKLLNLNDIASTEYISEDSRREIGGVYLPYQLERTLYNIVRDGWYSEREWNPNPHKPGLILPSWWDVC
jgi:hypothetical protein